MTDYDIYGKNPITGFALRMKVKNAEHFSSEVQKSFRTLASALEYPKQSKLDDYKGAEE